MRRFFGGAAALAVAAGLAFGAGSALAAESGTFEFYESAVHDYSTMKHADADVTVGPLHGTATIVKSSGGPFREGANFGATCLVYARKTKKGVHLEAPCAFTDAAGDKLWLIARRSMGDIQVGGGGRGVQRIVGGTGKYAGVTGNCPYRTDYLPDKWLVSKSTCSWSRP